MANKEFEFKLKIDAEINSLLQKLESVKTGLSNLNNAGKMPNLEKNFGSITKTLTKLQERIAQPVTSASTFTSTQKELASLQVAFSSLNKTIEDLQQLSREEKLTLIDDATLKNLKEANNAIANFKSAWEKNLASSDTAKQLKEQHDAAKKLNDAAEKKLQTKRQEYELRKQGIADEKARREEESKTAKEAVENLKQRQELLQRLQKARKDLASASSEQNDASENYRKIKETSDSKKKAFDEATSTRDTTSSQLEALKSWKATEAKYNHMDESGKKPDKRAAEYQRSKNSAKATGIDISTPEKLDAAIATLTKTLKSQNSAVVESSRAYNAAEKERKKYADRVEKLVAVEDGVAGSFDKTTGALNTSKVRKYGQEVDKLTDELKDLDPALEGLSDNELKKVLEDTNDSLSQQKKAVKEASAGYEKAVKTEEDFENEIKSLTETVEKSKVALENAKRVMDEAEESARAEAYKALAEQLKNCGDEFQDLPLEYTEDNFEAIKKIIEELESEALAKVDKTLVQLRGQFDATGKIIKDTEKKTADLKEEYASFTKANAEQEAFEAKIKSFLGLAGAAQVLRNAVRDAMETIKELDATMTEMAVVTDLTVGDYWDQLPEYSQQASNLGVSINSAYKAATLYYQQGLKANEVTAISAETLKMARIAGIDAADATDKMTAALRGFNMELNETSAQRVSDVYSELAAITAADTQEIANAMTKTASIASNAGMEFETTAAFLSQIIETTRESAETAGTAMKTVIARFQELKKDPAEIGEVDGEIVDANKIETALRSVGVSLRDTSGQFRDLDDVFIELSGKWDSLDTNTQRYIATIAAGSRQQSRFIAMMSNYSRTQELVAAANNSAGASNKQFEKTMDSLQAKIAKLENAWHEFTMGIMNSDLVKAGVDILTKLLEIINKATSGLDGMAGSITKILGILTVFKLGKTIFNKMKEPLLEFAQDIVTQMGIVGEKSGKAFAEKFKKAVDEAMETEPKPNTPEKPDPEEGSGVSPQEQEIEKKTAKQWLGEKTGASKIKAGAKALGRMNKGRRAAADVVNLEKQREEALANGTSEGLDKIEKKLKKAKEAQEDYNNNQQEIEEQGAQAWKTIGEGISSAGQALTGLGVGMSLIGGLLSSLGADGAGEVISAIGNGIMVAGAALSAVIPIITAIQALLSTPPLGIIMIILAAVVALITAIVVISKKLSLQNRMKEAAEATEAAKKAAEEAKEIYDSMLSDQSKYDELQKTLEELTYGTREWKKALIEANNQVLELLQNYPVLAKYLTRGEDGQLAIQDEGWDALIKQQEKAIANSQALVSVNQQNEQDLKMERSTKDFREKATVTRYNGKEQYVDYAATAGLTEELKDLYLVQGSNLEENVALVEELATKYGITTDQIWSAAEALENSKQEIESLALESENLARASLTALAPEAVTKDEQGQQIIDAFATSQTLDHYESMITNRANELYSKDGVSESQNNEEFKKLAAEYNVSDQMTGKDKTDLEILYKAMAGVEEVPEKLAGNTTELKKAIAAMDVANTTNQKMADYVLKLNSLGSQQQNNVAGIFSQEGLGMSAEFADALVAGFEDEVEGNAVLSEQAAAMGMTIEEWASALNMTVEDFYDTAEKNARSAQTARIKSFEKLNKALGKSDEERIKRFGETAQLSAAQEEALSQKLINVASLSGNEAASGIAESLGAALDSVGNNADELAAYLSSMNWQDVGDWEELREVLKERGITWTEEVATFANNAMIASHALKIVDFEKLNSELKSVYDTLNNIRSGEQKRSFDEETYKLLVTSNKDLAKDFVQIGDEFIYVGTSMNMLTEALENNTIAILGEAKQQYAAKIEMANAVDKTKASYGGKELFIDSDYSKWSELELREYLEEYRKAAWNMTSGEGGTQDGNALSYLDTEGIGLSFATDFSDYSQETLVQMMDLIKENYDNLPNLMEADRKALEDSLVTGYALRNDGKENASRAYELRGAGDEEGAELYSRALMTQASQSGMVSEEVLSKYAELLEKYTENPEDEDIAKKLKELEASMSSGIDKVIENKEGNATLIELQNRLADAIAESQQKEIDKLSEVNNSIQAGNGALIQKMQEQINKDRQKRANQKTENDIADLQARRSYLALDSNANALEIAELDKQIANAEESYQDTLVDQALQNLSDVNEKAAEQGERQISLLQQQLDEEKNNGTIIEEAKRILNESLQDVRDGVAFVETKAGGIISNTENWSSMTPEKYAQTEEDAQKAAVEAADIVNNQKLKDEQEALGKGIDTDLNQNANAVTGGDSIAVISNLIKGLNEEATKRDTAVQSGYNAVMDARNTGNQSDAYKSALADYIKAGGSAENFASEVSAYAQQQGNGKYFTGSQITTGDFSTSSFSISGGWNDKMYTNGTDDNIEVTLPDGTKAKNLTIHVSDETPNAEANEAIEKMISGTPSEKQLAMYNGTPYVYRDKKWRRLSGGDVGVLTEAMKGELNKYETGGLADFTGPAWLDGTKSHPELVLNQRDTANFIQLKDILAEVMNRSTADTKSKTTGDNYFEIAINVDSIESDYDVEQIADKIRDMIYQDATYRNVNAINWKK